MPNHEKCDVDAKTSVWRSFPKGAFQGELVQGDEVEFEIAFMESVPLDYYDNLELRIDTATVLKIFPQHQEKNELTLSLLQISGMYRRTKVHMPINRKLKFTLTANDKSLRIWLPILETIISIPIAENSAEVKLNRNPKSASLSKVTLTKSPQRRAELFPFSLSDMYRNRERSGRWDWSCQDGKYYCPHLDTCLEPLTPCQNSSYSIWRLNGLYKNGEKTPDVKIALADLNFEPDFLTVTSKGGQGQVRIYDRDTGHYGRISMVHKYAEEVIWVWSENNTDSITKIHNSTNDTILGFAFVRHEGGTAVYLAHGENVAKLDVFPRIKTWRKIILSSFHIVLAVNAEGSAEKKNSALVSYKAQSPQNESNKTIMGYLIVTVLGLMALLVIILVGFTYKDRKTYSKAKTGVAESNSNACAREAMLRSSNFCMNDASAAVFEEIEMKEFKVYNEYYDSSSGVLPAIPEEEWTTSAACLRSGTTIRSTTSTTLTTTRTSRAVEEGRST